MAEVSCELRVYPNKELFAVDMAEIVDATSWGNHVIQGCTVYLSDNKLAIRDGRLLIGGRLAVVTGGDIANPALDATDSGCHLVAFCDLQNTATPVKIELISSTDYANRLASVSDRATFNTEAGTAMLNLGACTVNPNTGYVYEWEAANTATPIKGYGIRNTIEDMMTIKTGAFTINTDGISVVAEENFLRKQMGIVECKIRFTAASIYLTADKLIMTIPEGFRPITVVRPILVNWSNPTEHYRLNIYSTGEVRLVDPIPNGTIVILTVMYMTAFDPIIKTLA